MEKKTLTKKDLLYLVNRRNKVQLVWGIIATAFGGFWTLLITVLVCVEILQVAFLLFPVGPLVAGIILISTRKTKRAAMVENDAFTILAMPVIGKDIVKNSDDTTYLLYFPEGHRKYVSQYDYDRAPIGAIYYFIVFGEKDWLGKCYTAAAYQLSAELLPRVKTVA